MGEMTKEDVLELRLVLAALRLEIAELRRELTSRGLSPMTAGTDTDKEMPEGATTEQIMTEWTEGEEAWQARSK